jgi:hypothetical protein
MENEQTLAVFCTETDILAILENDAIQALMEQANVSLLEAAEAMEKCSFQPRKAYMLIESRENAALATGKEAAEQACKDKREEKEMNARGENDAAEEEKRVKSKAEAKLAAASKAVKNRCEVWAAEIEYEREREPRPKTVAAIEEREREVLEKELRGDCKLKQDKRFGALDALMTSAYCSALADGGSGACKVLADAHAQHRQMEAQALEGRQLLKTSA